MHLSLFFIFLKRIRKRKIKTREGLNHYLLSCTAVPLMLAGAACWEICLFLTDCGFKEVHHL